MPGFFIKVLAFLASPWGKAVKDTAKDEAVEWAFRRHYGNQKKEILASIVELEAMPDDPKVRKAIAELRAELVEVEIKLAKVRS